MKLALSIVLGLALLNGCAGKSMHQERTPAASPVSMDALRVFVGAVLKNSSHGESVAAKELLTLYNEAATREGGKLVDDLDTLFRESPETRARALRWFTREPELAHRLGIDPRSDALKRFFGGREESVLVARENFIAGDAPLEGNVAAKIAKADPAGKSRLKRVAGRLYSVAQKSPALKRVVDKMVEDLVFVYSRTRQRIVGESGCEILQPESVQNLAKVVDGVAGDVKQAGRLSSKEVDRSLDRSVARVTGEDERLVRELRVCPLIKNCGIFDASRAAGCVR